MFYDLGGGSRIRGVWPQYFADVHGLVYVVDASDPARLTESAAELHSAVLHPMALGKPLLVLANKSDVAGALKEPDLTARMELDRLTLCRHTVAPVSAQRAEDGGLSVGLQWLVRAIEAELPALTERREREQAAHKTAEEEKRRERSRLLREGAAAGVGAAQASGEAAPAAPVAAPLCKRCGAVPAVRRCAAAGWEAVCSACAEAAEAAKAGEVAKAAAVEKGALLAPALMTDEEARPTPVRVRQALAPTPGRDGERDAPPSATPARSGAVEVTLGATPALSSAASGPGRVEEAEAGGALPSQLVFDAEGEAEPAEAAVAAAPAPAPTEAPAPLVDEGSPDMGEEESAVMAVLGSPVAATAREEPAFGSPSSPPAKRSAGAEGEGSVGSPRPQVDLEDVLSADCGLPGARSPEQ